MHRLVIGAAGMIGRHRLGRGFNLRQSHRVDLDGTRALSSQWAVGVRLAHERA